MISLSPRVNVTLVLTFTLSPSTPSGFPLTVIPKSTPFSGLSVIDHQRQQDTIPDNDTPTSPLLSLLVSSHPSSEYWTSTYITLPTLPFWKGGSKQRMKRTHQKEGVKTSVLGDFHRETNTWNVSCRLVWFINFVGTDGTDGTDAPPLLLGRPGVPMTLRFSSGTPSTKTLTFRFILYSSYNNNTNYNYEYYKPNLNRTLFCYYYRHHHHERLLWNKHTDV